MQALKRYAKVYAVCVGLFTLLLVIVSFVPRAAIQRQLEESAGILATEGDRPVAWPAADLEVDYLDSFTTALSLNIASHAVGHPFVGAFAGSYFVGQGSRVEQFAEGLGKEAQVEYARYWHGYLSVLVPLLVVCNIDQIRVLFLILMVTLACVATSLMGRRRRMGAAVCLGIALLFANVLFATVSTSLAFSFFVALGATVWVLIRVREDDERLCDDVDGVNFFVIGALTVFLDFLNTPIVTLGLPLATYAMLRKRTLAERPAKESLVRLGILFFAWGAGYGLVWATKWIIGFVVCGSNVFEGVVGLAGSWTSGTPEGVESVSRMDVIRENLGQMLPRWLVLVCAGLAVVWAGLMLRFRRRGSGTLVLALLCAAALPFVWYLVLATHSHVHSFFAYRNLCVSVYALGLIACYAMDWRALRDRLSFWRGAVVSRALPEGAKPPLQNHTQPVKKGGLAPFAKAPLRRSR